jgi:tetratricopeptide (TPR) repeat protein
MRRSVGVVVLAVLAVVPACAPKAAVVPVITAPRFPDFVEPAVPQELAASPAAAFQDRAWRFLQAGDVRNARREVATALRRTPGFYPAEALGGYVELAGGDPRAALARFDRALGARANYAPALVGKGEALLLLEREGDALAAFQAALVADTTHAEVGRRVEVLKFRSMERDVATARQLARAGRRDDARRAYRMAIERSPDTAFLYRELATIEQEAGEPEGALGHFRQAVVLDPADRDAWIQIAGILDDRNELEAALQAYAEALKLEPDSDLAARRDALRARADLAQLPAPYRAIGQAPQITRGDLAALIGVRLASLLAATRPRAASVLTDIRGHWAEPWILAATRAGVMDGFANHTFQPRGVVRRIDFAQVVSRLLATVAQGAPSEARRWTNARGTFPDLTSAHLAFPAASVATAAGVMDLAPDGSFQPSRAVSGAEAVAAFTQLEALVKALPTTAGPR